MRRVREKSVPVAAAVVAAMEEVAAAAAGVVVVAAAAATATGASQLPAFRPLGQGRGGHIKFESANGPA